MYLHGGGYCIGNIESYRACLLEFSKKTGLRYLAVDYSLAPENPYPCALNECLEVCLLVIIIISYYFLVLF